MDDRNDFPEYEEYGESSPFKVKNNASFSANKDEIYRRNQLLAMEELAKERADAEKARADKIAEYENMYREAEIATPEIDEPPKNWKLTLALVVTAVAVLSMGYLIRAYRTYKEEYKPVIIPESSASGESSHAVSAAERISAEISIYKMQLFSAKDDAETPPFIHIVFMFTLKNIGDEEFSFIEEDFRLKLNDGTLIDNEYITAMSDVLTIEPGKSGIYSAGYNIGLDRISDIAGFSYDKHTEAEYAANEVNADYIENFFIEFSDEGRELFVSTAEELIAEHESKKNSAEESETENEAEISAGEQEAAGIDVPEEAAEAVSETESRKLPSPFEETAGAYVYNTDSVSLRFTAKSEPVYVDGALFNNTWLITVEARNLTSDTLWIYASNFYFSDGSTVDRIRDQLDYDDETTYFSAWQSSGDSEERTRSPIAFGFDGDGECKFTLKGFILAENIDKYNIFGYDEKIGFASAMASSYENMTSIESFEFPLEKLVKTQ